MESRLATSSVSDCLDMVEHQMNHPCPGCGAAMSYTAEWVIGWGTPPKDYCDECKAQAVAERQEREQREGVYNRLWLASVPENMQRWSDKLGAKHKHLYEFATANRERSIWLHGATGAGKSTSLCGALRDAIEDNFCLRCKYVNAVDFAAAIDNRAVGYVGELLRMELVVLDDFGAGRISGDAGKALYRLFDAAYSTGSPRLWVASNLASDKLPGKFADQAIGKRIVGRAARMINEGRMALYAPNGGRR